MLCVSAESLNKGFTIIIDNRLGNLTTSVKKLLSAAEVDQTFLQQKHLSYIVFYSSTFARLQGNQMKCHKKRLFYFTFISASELLKPHGYKHNHCFTAIIQVILRLPAPPVRNCWRILLVQSFTARMPLLTATSAIGLGRRRWSSHQQCYLHCLRTSEIKQIKC